MIWPVLVLVAWVVAAALCFAYLDERSDDRFSAWLNRSPSAVATVLVWALWPVVLVVAWATWRD